MNVQLMQHQKEAVEFAVSNKGVSAFFMEVGTGKTLSALGTFTELRKNNPKLKLFVICPLSLIRGAWTREIDKFTSFKWCDLHSGTSDWSNPDGKWDIYLINFEYLVSEKKFEALKKFLDASPDWMCAIDESSKLKNNKALTVQRILKLRDSFKHRIVMSGTPAPNVEWEYWPQMYFLNDKILGNNFYKFKNMCFALRRGNQQMPGQLLNRASIRKMHEQGFKYEIIPKKRDEMFARMKPWCFSVKAKDCIDLPEETDEFRVVELHAEQRKIYKQMKDAYVAELSGGTFAVANIVLTKLMRLRQITSGFVTDDKGDSIAISATTPKINELVDIIEECGQEQMIIWCNFHWEIDQIRELLHSMGHQVSELHGRIAHTQRMEHLDKFLDGTNRFLIAHPDSAAHGLTLTNCHISVFYSLDYSMEGYSQARGRTYRKGQKNNCVYFHLIAKDTIDEDVLAIVQKKQTAQEIADKHLKR